MYYFIIIIIIQLNTGTTLLHKTLPWPSWPTLQFTPHRDPPRKSSPNIKSNMYHRKTIKNLQPTHCKNSEIYTKPTTNHPKNWRPTASHRTQKPTTTQTPQVTAPKNPQQPEHHKPPHQTHQHKTQQTNKTTKKFTRNTILLGWWGSRSWRGEREARFVASNPKWVSRSASTGGGGGSRDSTSSWSSSTRRNQH